MLLKLFLEWIIGFNASGYGAFPVWKGWAIAAGLGSTGYLMCLVHHQLFWCAPSLLAHALLTLMFRAGMSESIQGIKCYILDAWFGLNILFD